MLSEDSYGGDLRDPLSLNRYTYANNKPVLYTDSSGKFAILVPLAIVGGGALIGGGISLFSQLVSNGWNFDSVSWRSVGASAAAGAVTAGVAMMTGGASLTAQSAVLSGALISGIGYGTYNLVNGSKATLEGYLYSMTFGALATGVGYRAAQGSTASSSLNKGAGKTDILSGKTLTNQTGKVNNYVSELKGMVLLKQILMQ
jgi:hypothetical protein